jgi:hypothetical protein
MATDEEQKLEDLWPGTIAEPSFKAPAVILREQADLLGRRTKGVVRAEVRPMEQLKGSKRISFSFNIVAPFLNNYRLRLLTIWHEPTKVYPTFISSSLLPASAEDEQSDQRVVQADTEKDFRERVKELFAHETTVRAIESLWVQSKGISDPEPL